MPSSLCEIAITGKQATRFFLLWSLSVASSFLHLQLNQETGAGKEPKNSVVPQLFSDSWWRWDLLLNYRKRHNNHSPCSLFLLFTLLHHIFLGFSNNHILFAGLLSVLPSAINWLWYPPHPQTPRSIAPTWDFLLIQWNLQVFCEAPTTPTPLLQCRWVGQIKYRRIKVQNFGFRSSVAVSMLWKDPCFKLEVNDELPNPCSGPKWRYQWVIGHYNKGHQRLSTTRPKLSEKSSRTTSNPAPTVLWALQSFHGRDCTNQFLLCSRVSVSRSFF